MTAPRSGRADTSAGRLARMGVSDAQRISAGLADVSWWSTDLLDDVASAADPGQVLRAALALDEVAADRIALVAGNPRAWRRFALTTGVSIALSEHLARHPEHLEILFEDAQREFERMFIARALAKTDFNVCKAAKITGLHRNTLSRKISTYRIKRAG